MILKTSLLAGMTAIAIATPSLAQQKLNASYGDNLHDVSGSIHVMQDGSFAMYGRSQRTGTDTDGVIAVLNDNGVRQWITSYGYTGSYEDFDSGIETTDGSHVAVGKIIHTGVKADNQFLVKTDNTGALIWSMTYGYSGYDRANFVLEDDPGYVVVGEYFDPLLGGQASITLVDKGTGMPVWMNLVGDSMNDRFLGVALTPDDGGYVATGSYTNLGGDVDVLVCKFDNNGLFQWGYHIGDDYENVGIDIQYTSDGNYLITGKTYSVLNNDDMIAIKMDRLGNILWSYSYGSTGSERATGAREASGEFYISGFSNSFGWGDYDAVLMKITGLGNTVFVNGYGGTREDKFSNIDLTYIPSIALTGFNTDIMFPQQNFYFLHTNMNGDNGPACQKNTTWWIPIPFGTRYAISDDNGHEPVKVDPLTPAETMVFQDSVFCRATFPRTVGTSDPLFSTVTLSPNPFTGEITLTLPAGAASVEVLDVHGRTVVRRELSGVNASVFDLSDQSNGVYLFRVTSSAGTEVHKAILAR